MKVPIVCQSRSHILRERHVPRTLATWCHLRHFSIFKASTKHLQSCRRSLSCLHIWSFQCRVSMCTPPLFSLLLAVIRLRDHARVARGPHTPKTLWTLIPQTLLCKLPDTPAQGLRVRSVHDLRHTNVCSTASQSKSCRMYVYHEP